jgi:hypothetical protein
MAHIFLRFSLFAFLLISGCSTSLPTKHYDASKNNQMQFDFDSSRCELAMTQQYGSQYYAPMNYIATCMKSQGWHY